MICIAQLGHVSIQCVFQRKAVYDIHDNRICDHLLFYIKCSFIYTSYGHSSTGKLEFAYIKDTAVIIFWMWHYDSLIHILCGTF